MDEPQFCLDELADSFPALPAGVTTDREINVQMVLSCATAPSTALCSHLAPEWIHDLDFWIDLPKNATCPCSVWNLVPIEIATNAGVVLSWARHASPGDSIEWLENAVMSSPSMRLLSDRQTLLNWLPQLCSDDPRADELFRRISPESMDKPMWLELLRKGRPPSIFMSHTPWYLRNDPDIVDAQLLCTRGDGRLFCKCFRELADKLQRQFSHRLVQAMLSDSDESSFERSWFRLFRARPNLSRIPEVALAALSKGWGPKHRGFEDFVNSSPWSGDPAFLLAAAGAIPYHQVRDPAFRLRSEDATRKKQGSRTFWACCSSALRRDKSFLLQVLHRTKVPRLYMDEDLENDFDIKCAKLLRGSEKDLRETATNDPAFVRDVRGRLQQYLSLEAFMAGVQAAGSAPRRKHGRDGRRPLTTSSLAQLSQDDDTLRDFKTRMLACLGCPADLKEASVLRSVSNKFTMYGY
jgi:hypothetical protein